jgi:hypothetical protein
VTVLTDCSIRFLFCENACLAMCPLMSFLTMAFLDNAFEAPQLRTPQDLFGLRVPSTLRCLELRFRSDILSTPLFRNGQGDRPLCYTTNREWIMRIGRLTGFRGVLTSYCLRRGTANAIHGMVLILHGATDC